MSYANIQDVSVRYGRPVTGTEAVAQVQAWIADTEALIKSRIPDLDERLSGGLVQAPVLVAVICNAVIRKLKNPDGKQNERIDDYSYGRTEDAARGELFLTDEEWALLTGGDGTSEGAFTIGLPIPANLRRGSWVTSDTWVPHP